MAGDPNWNNVVLAMHMDDVGLSDLKGQTRDAWGFAQDFKRLDPLVIGLGQVVGVTDTQLDDLFVLASTL